MKTPINMNYKQVTKEVENILANKQDPDTIQYTKQWDETGRLKGWHVNFEWGNYSIWIDITPYYTRIIGDLSKVPDYKQGIHQVMSDINNENTN